MYLLANLAYKLLRSGYFCQILLVTLLFSSQTSFAQRSTKEDSLKLLIDKTDNDVDRMTWLNMLSYQLIANEPEKSLAYAEEAMALARVLKHKDQEIRALLNIGIHYYYDRETRDSSLSIFVEGAEMAEALGYAELQSDHLMRIANYHRYRTKDSIKVVQNLMKSIEVSKAGKYHYGTGRSYAKLASFYTQYKQIELSKEFLKESAKYYLQCENGAQQISHYYDEVGNKIWNYSPQKSMDFFFEGIKHSDKYPNPKVSLAKAYISINQPKMALKYLNEALEILTTTPYPRVKGIALAKLSEVYLKLEQREEALETCNIGIELLQPLSRKSKSALPALYRIKGQLQELKGNNESAIKYYIQSTEEGDLLGQPYDVVHANISLGKYYASKNEAKKGLEYCKTAYKRAKSNNYANLQIDACDCLFAINKGEKSYVNAIKYLEIRNELRDSLSNLKMEYSLEINNKLLSKNKELDQESYAKELKVEQLQFQYKINRVLLITSLLGTMFIVSLLWGRRSFKRQNEEINNQKAKLLETNTALEKSNEELERFAHLASHDLKSPLRSIISFVGLLRKKLGDKQDPTLMQYVGYIENNGTRMSNLIDDILEFSKLSNQDLNHHELIELEPLINEISELTLTNYNGKEAKISVSEMPKFKWNYAKIFLLFKNLIENGLKYNESENPHVNIYYDKLDGQHNIYIEDNGIGVKQEYFEKIFVMFNRLHGQEKYSGSGLGLATCKKIVNEFKGAITVESEIAKGSVFTIAIPDTIILN